MKKKNVLVLCSIVILVIGMIFGNSITVFAHERGDEDTNIIYDDGDSVGNGAEVKTINQITITASSEPKIGDYVDDITFNVTNDLGYNFNQFNIVRYDGEYKNVGDSSFKGYDGVIEENYIYEYWFECDTESGYVFSDDTVVDLNLSNAHLTYDFYDNVGYIYISFCFGLDEINEVNCEISGLEVGNKISDVELLISESANYFIKPLGYNEDETLCNYQWTDLNSDEMNLMSDNDVFEEGKIYRLYCEIVPKKGFYFSDNLKVNDQYNQPINRDFSIYSGEMYYCVVYGPMCKHEFNYTSDSNNHWLICNKCKITNDVQTHIYDDYRDENCNVCGYKRVISVPDVSVSYRTHIQNIGWEGDFDNLKTWKSNGDMSGTSGMSKRLEAINIKVEGNDNLGIQYTTHCQNYGWLPWSANSDMSGTEGESKRLEAIKIQLTGRDADLYDVHYRVHAQTFGWLDWAMNGEVAGTAGYSKRLEGIQIVIVKKNDDFDHSVGDIDSVDDRAFVAIEGNSPIVNYPDTSNTSPVIPGADTPNVSYRTHVQSFGWQAWKYNGQMSGTSGMSKRLEGININLTNKDYAGDIVYTTHVQGYGWQGELNDQSTWVKNGNLAGTKGESKRLEAICINLTGEMANHYDIYYRVHAQSYGWLGWAKNGEEAGTAGYSKRLEGIQIVLVEKNGVAPTDYMGIKSDNDKAYIEAN